jgi:hypothetical protein
VLRGVSKSVSKCCKMADVTTCPRDGTGWFAHASGLPIGKLVENQISSGEK